MGTSQMVLRVKAIAADHTMQLGLVEGKRVRIGRTPNNECAVEWDREVSREHAIVEMRGEEVRIVCAEGARDIREQ